MIQPFNLHFGGSRFTIAQHFNGNNPLSSVLFQRIWTIEKGTLHLFRYGSHITLPKIIREFQNSEQIKYLVL